MLNPYEPPQTESLVPRRQGRGRRHVFAGTWLVFVGVLYLIVDIVVSSNRALANLNWSPALIAVLGLLVLLRFRLAIVLTCFFGSFAIVAMVTIAISMLAAHVAGGDLTSSPTNVGPAPLEVGAVLFVIGFALIPPWWALQREFADSSKALKS